MQGEVKVLEVSLPPGLWEEIRFVGALLGIYDEERLIRAVLRHGIRAFCSTRSGMDILESN